jgi:hypothetical protein
MTDKQVLNSVKDFVNDIIDMNLKMGLKINNPVWVELLIQNIENEYGEYLSHRNDLQMKVAEIISNLFKTKVK